MITEFVTTHHSWGRETFPRKLLPFASNKSFIECNCNLGLCIWLISETPESKRKVCIFRSAIKAWCVGGFISVKGMMDGKVGSKDSI